MADLDPERLARQLARERRAREEAERLLEEKSRELYASNTRLEALLLDLERQVRDRTAELGLALVDAQRASRVKSDFLAMVSHEIRTPMNVVLGMSELLLDSALDSQQRSMLTSIHDSSKALLGIINDLLDLSSIEAGKIGLEKVPFDLGKTLKSVMEGFVHRAELKGLKLDFELPAAGELSFIGDPGRLRQVLVNLVSNAIKYTVSGSVTVRIERLSREEGYSRVRCSVRDTGPGIPRESQELLFTRYARLEHDHDEVVEGVGLGLALCRQLIELLDGSIGVESQPGQGSLFWFVVPLQDADGVADRTDAGQQGSAPGCAERASLRILVAEDNPANQVVARLMLEKMGHRVDLAGDGNSAVAAARSNAYDVIMMDVRMPGMDGLEATREIRRLEGVRGAVPIIALTANAMASDREKCLAAGMTGFATKPLSRAVLERVLEEHERASASAGAERGV
jgi:signal transduction histidine kinase/CheY-like chemotaxis protein